MYWSVLNKSSLHICVGPHHGPGPWTTPWTRGGPWTTPNFQKEIALVKVPITPKSFFRSNKSLHLFETHCAILPLFNPNIDLLQAVQVTKSGHLLSHDRAIKGMGLFLVWRHKLICMHVYKDLIRCKSVYDIKQGIDPCPLLTKWCDRWWLDFVTFTT